MKKPKLNTSNTSNTVNTNSSNFKPQKSDYKKTNKKREREEENFNFVDFEQEIKKPRKNSDNESNGKVDGTFGDNKSSIFLDSAFKPNPIIFDSSPTLNKNSDSLKIEDKSKEEKKPFSLDDNPVYKVLSIGADSGKYVLDKTVISKLGDKLSRNIAGNMLSFPSKVIDGVNNYVDAKERGSKAPFIETMLQQGADELISTVVAPEVEIGATLLDAGGKIKEGEGKCWEDIAKKIPDEGIGNKYLQWLCMEKSNEADAIGKGLQLPQKILDGAKNLLINKPIEKFIGSEQDDQNTENKSSSFPHISPYVLQKNNTILDYTVTDKNSPVQRQQHPQEILPETPSPITTTTKTTISPDKSIDNSENDQKSIVGKTPQYLQTQHATQITQAISPILPTPPIQTNLNLNSVTTPLIGKQEIGKKQVDGNTTISKKTKDFIEKNSNQFLLQPQVNIEPPQNNTQHHSHGKIGGELAIGAGGAGAALKLGVALTGPQALGVLAAGAIVYGGYKGKKEWKRQKQRAKIRKQNKHKKKVEGIVNNILLDEKKEKIDNNKIDLASMLTTEMQQTQKEIEELDKKRVEYLAESKICADIENKNTQRRKKHKWMSRVNKMVRWTGVDTPNDKKSKRLAAQAKNDGLNKANEVQKKRDDLTKKLEQQNKDLQKEQQERQKQQELQRQQELKSKELQNTVLKSKEKEAENYSKKNIFDITLKKPNFDDFVSNGTFSKKSIFPFFNSKYKDEKTSNNSSNLTDLKLHNSIKFKNKIDGNISNLGNSSDLFNSIWYPKNTMQHNINSYQDFGNFFSPSFPTSSPFSSSLSSSSSNLLNLSKNSSLGRSSSEFITNNSLKFGNSINTNDTNDKNKEQNSNKFFSTTTPYKFQPDKFQFDKLQFGKK